MAAYTCAHHINEEPMEIDTRYGKQTVAPSTLLSFPDGIPGFEQLRAFTLFHEEDTINVHFLQSTEDADVRLPVVTPEVCKIDYRIELSDAEEARLDYAPGDEILVLLVLSDDQEQGGSIKANLMGPILINVRSRLGMQKVLNRVDGAVVIDAR